MPARLIIESLLHGEWWIYPDGDVFFCDGDVSDTNHEIEAALHAMSKVRDEMALNDADDERDSSEQLLADIRTAWAEDASEEELAQHAQSDEYDIAALMAAKHHVDAGLLAVATNRSGSDPRRYAAQHWGWSALRGDHVETWDITEKSLTTIARGIDSALDETGVDAEDIDPEHVFWIHAYKGNRALSLTYAEIEKRDFSQHFEQPPSAPPDKVRKLDQEQSPDFYKGNLGDSAKRLVSHIISEGDIRYGWAKGEHVVEVPFADDEDSHHLCQTNLLPDGNDTDWKRWRYNDEIGTVFWWETPTLQEREAVAAETGCAPEDQVYVELRSPRWNGRGQAVSQGMRTFHVDDFPEERDGSNALMNATHRPDANVLPVVRAMSRDGD